MEHSPISPELSVAEALAAAPAAAAVLLHNKTACVGCYLARFCALRDVATTYGLSLEAFLEELQRVAPAQTSFLVGAHHEESL